MIPAQESDRTRVGATCSRKFKGKVEDYAQRHGKTVADVVIMALAGLLDDEQTVRDLLDEQDEPAGRRK